MFVGSSEIRLSVIVKHVQHIGNFVCLGDFISFSVLGKTEKVAGLWFASGISTRVDTMSNKPLLFSIVIQFLVSVTFPHTPNHSLNWLGTANRGVILKYTVNTHK